MKVIKGISSLYRVLKELKNMIEDESINATRSAILPKVKPLYYEILLTKTYIFYVKKDVILASYLDAEFNEIASEIIWCDEIEALLTLSNIDIVTQKSYKISWIVIEVFTENITNLKTTDEHIIKSREHMKVANFLDRYKKEGVIEDQKKMYRFDFMKLEKLFLNSQITLAKLLRNSKKYFYLDIFKIQLSDNKNNVIGYVNQILEPIEYENIQITKNSHKQVFNYRCQICEKVHKVILSKSQRDKNKHVKKYRRVTNDFIRLEEVKGKERFVIICNHEGTDYENNYIYFSFESSNLNMKDRDRVNLNKVFLYQFYNYVNQDVHIHFVRNNKSMSISVEKYIAKFESNDK